jgi:endogenous inhibitor of DNA gyrase (YacG/DUF329 family)
VWRTCPCGQRFSVPASQAALGHGTYCSKRCQRIYPAERGADHRTLPRDEPPDLDTRLFPGIPGFPAKSGPI